MGERPGKPPEPGFDLTRLFEGTDSGPDISDLYREPTSNESHEVYDLDIEALRVADSLAREQALKQGTPSHRDALLPPPPPVEKEPLSKEEYEYLRQAFIEQHGVGISPVGMVFRDGRLYDKNANPYPEQFLEMYAKEVREQYGNGLERRVKQGTFDHRERSSEEVGENDDERSFGSIFWGLMKKIKK